MKSNTANPDRIAVNGNGAPAAPETDDSASLEMMLSTPDRAKRREMPWHTYEAHVTKRGWILDLLAIGMPVAEIAKRTGIGRTLIMELGAMYHEQLEKNCRDFSRYFKTRALRYAFFADQKAKDAPFAHLAMAATQFAQTGMDLEMVGAATLDDQSDVIDVETSNPALASARAFVRQLNEKNGEKK